MPVWRAHPMNERKDTYSVHIDDVTVSTFCDEALLWRYEFHFDTNTNSQLPRLPACVSYSITSDAGGRASHRRDRKVTYITERRLGSRKAT